MGYKHGCFVTSFLSRIVTNMRKALDIDWPAIKEGRSKGLSFKELANRYGGTEAAIRQRANRERWSLPGLRQAGAVMDRIVPKGIVLKRLQENVAVKAEVSLAKALERLVTKSVSQAEEIMDRSHSALSQAENPRDLLMAAKSWEVGHNGARKALGLDSPTGQGATAWAGQSAPQAASGIVLDAEEVPSTPDPQPETPSNPEQPSV